MENADIVRRLNQMREAQVVLRRFRISKQDMLQIREAPLDIKAIDRAMANEVGLPEGKPQEGASTPFGQRG